MANKRIEELLVPTFPKKHVVAMLRHYADEVSEYQTSHWEKALTKVGKFVEAVLKALFEFIGETLPAERGFKVDNIINKLKDKPQDTYDDSIRILIPRACRFIYDIASNRGGRHDPGEIDPNEMDAGISISTCSWILAEMIRLSQKGVVDIEEAKTLVDSLIERKYPFIEDVEGRVYFHIADTSATDIALLALAHQHPQRLTKQALLDTIKLNRFSNENAQKAVQRISPFIDNDGNGLLRLLSTGLKKADEILKRGHADI